MAISDDSHTVTPQPVKPETIKQPETRIAVPADRAQVEELDAICFPQNDVDLEPADPLELVRGIENGTVIVVAEGDRILAYLHYECPTKSHVYLSAIAVHPARRKSGYARHMFAFFRAHTRLAERDSVSSLSTVTSIRNLSMLSFLLASGFVGRTVMDDYFGPGRARVYCQYKTRVEWVDPDERYIVPVDAAETVERLLRDERYVITSLVELPKGPAFEFSRFDSDDFGALESNETAAGVQFSGVVLGAITFLLGFSFAGSSTVPDPARTLLTGAAFATTISLIIYANTSGESARLRSNAFGYYMKWGNVLSEYGGVLPLLIALPITLAGVASSHPAVIVSSVILSGSLVLYERSRFSMSSRFARSPLTRLCAFLICTSPISGVSLLLAVHPGPSHPSSWPMWVWTAVTAAALTVLSGIYLLKRPEEQVMEQRPLGWEPRR